MVRSRALINLIVMTLIPCGCAGPQARNPFASAPVKKPPLKSKSDGTGDKESLAAKAKSKAPRSSATEDEKSGPNSIAKTKSGHDPATMALIERELSDATPKEREDLIKELNGVRPDMVRLVLKSRRMGLKYQEQQLAGATGENRIANNPSRADSRMQNNANAMADARTLAAASGLGSTNPWSQSGGRDFGQTNPALALRDSGAHVLPAGGAGNQSYPYPQNPGQAPALPGSGLAPGMPAGGAQPGYANQYNPYASNYPGASGASPGLNGQSNYPVQNPDGSWGNSAWTNPAANVAGTGTNPAGPANQPGPAGQVQPGGPPYTGQAIYAGQTGAPPANPGVNPSQDPRFFAAVNTNGTPQNGAPPVGPNADLGNLNPGQYNNPAQYNPGAAPIDVQRANYNPLSRAASADPRGPLAPPSNGVDPAIATMPNSPSPNSWNDYLQKVIDVAAAEATATRMGPTDVEKQAYVEKQVYLRMLYLMAGQQERALQAIPGLEPADQEFWTQTFWGLANYFDAKTIPQGSDRATQTVAQFTTAVMRLQEKANLELRNVAFCKTISSFGNYERFPRDEFSPGQPVLLYGEVANFHSEPTADGNYRTILRSTLEIYKPGPQGELVERNQFPATEDVCRNHRRDYFHSYEYMIPPKIALGPHVMKLSVEDQLSRKVATYTLNFTVK